MLKLKVKTRELVGKKLKELRDNKIIPAVIYGHGIKSINVQVPYLDFEKIYKQAGQSSLLEIEIKGSNNESKKIKALIYDLQYNPVTSKISHIDFYKTKAGEKIKVEVGLKFIGQAPAIKNLGGVLIIVFNKIEVECLPEDLIHEIEVDVSVLKTFEDSIRIKDLNIPKELEPTQDQENMVVHVERPKEEVIEEETTEEDKVEESEKEEDKKEEDKKEEDKQEEDKKEQDKKE